ncbi:DUF2059 domain-containing protein [Rhizobiaceae bacterium BDR2-2]|uniref:DUF2059 domain-containing protein n=1 Tax=Ectorhizobium quercum TaxID=2965071 RepID=A0AAE3N2V1_9HYPH|nr:DUF2059 domain-containing protein [Ectorhizobium quercum]MCX8999838.1 DUF2059 domain-containing protein [Ectorhizobium quercum]
MIRFAGVGRAAVIAVLLSGIAMTVPARAQEPSEEQIKAAREAITALGVTDQFDNILPMIAERLKAAHIQTYPDLQQQISDIVDEKALALVQRRADLERESAAIYAKTFSVQELNDIAAFYRTEAGKKLLKDGPIAMRELLRAADIWGAGIDRDLNTSVAEELQKVVSAPVPAEGTTPGATAPNN